MHAEKKEQQDEEKSASANVEEDEATEEEGEKDEGERTRRAREEEKSCERASRSAAPDDWLQRRQPMQQLQLRWLKTRSEEKRKEKESCGDAWSEHEPKRKDGAKQKREEERA